MTQLLINPSIPLTGIVQTSARELDPDSTTDGYGAWHYIYRPELPWMVRNVATQPGTTVPSSDYGRFNSLIPRVSQTIIEASNRTSILTFTQRIVVDAGRYVNKVDLDLSRLEWQDDAAPDGWRNAVQVRQNYVINNVPIAGKWHPLAWETQGIALQVVQVDTPMAIDIEIEVWIVWPQIGGDIVVTGMTMESVSPTYGDDNPSTIIRLGSSPTPPDGGDDPLPPVDPPWIAIGVGALALLLTFIGVLFYVILRLTQVNQSLGAQLSAGGNMLDFMSLEQSGVVLIGAILTILGTASVSPLTDQLVTAIKAIERSLADLTGRQFEIDARWYNLAVSLAITVAGWIGVHYDVMAGVNNVFDFLVRALPLAASVLGLFIGHKATYFVAKKIDFPLASYQRPQQATDKGAIPF